jgi:hypothetical protein
MDRLTAQLQEQLLASAAQTPAEAVDFTIGLWEALAARLIPIIGDDGFRSLLQRNLHLTSKVFPWLAMDLSAWDHSERFSGLRANLRCRNPGEAADAGLALLTAFVETLVALLGVPVVSNLLRSAWGDHIVQRWGSSPDS